MVFWGEHPQKLCRLLNSKWRNKKPCPKQYWIWTPYQADETTSTDSLDGSADISTTVELFPEDTPTETSSGDSGHSESESAETFDPNAVDWARVDPNTVPEQYKPVQEAVKQQQADYTRKMQDLADQRRQQETQQAELANMQREWADRVQAVAPAPQQLDPVQQLRMQSTDEENKAMDFMDFLCGTADATEVQRA